jgi:hypothetical protein
VQFREAKVLKTLHRGSGRSLDFGLQLSNSGLALSLETNRDLARREAEGRNVIRESIATTA